MKNKELKDLKKFLKPKDWYELEQIEKEVLIQDNIKSGQTAFITQELHKALGTDENYLNFSSNYQRGIEDEYQQNNG